ncbi:serine--tRNA ligase [Magnetospirillum sp. UT-4]|uniref:serine--tRNA ligase n=1 Tax=Magnetospirillum sp. UT-4 TaxID=2681467 RepID=UPI001383060A|nr:serine--tRNA ligase [Magnetospirillum sp. UT-4]CAA7623735.1 seryl-tRNA synthetase, also charges selenocysteinyl-tRNA with serine [Magnetospirillum sp. UT-4]
MHDLKWIRDNPEAFDAGLARRGLPAVSAELLRLDGERRAAQTRLQEMQAARNEASRQIGMLKKQGGDASAMMAEVARLKTDIPLMEAQDKALGEEIERILANTPNLPGADVPDGPDEEHNVEIRRWGTPPAFDFQPLEHDALGEKLGMMDFEGAAKLSGARFVVLKGQLARLERALGQFMLDVQTAEHGYTEVSPPILVKDSALFGTGQLPKFKADLFATACYDPAAAGKKIVEASRSPIDALDRRYSGHALDQEVKGHIFAAIQHVVNELGDNLLADERFLIPTAEVPLTNLVADSILDEARLPLRMTALTPCFRSEAGAAGKDTRGMIRQHQFWKVELVSIAHPDQSGEEHERMTACAETILQRLGLPYRTVALCTGDMGFSARKTYDIEVWLPGQGRYREISSCSNCGDFQARRMKARFRSEAGNRFVHTLNGSGLAVGRTLVAVMENGQQADGRIVVPEALKPYMGGLAVIG